MSGQLLRGESADYCVIPLTRGYVAWVDLEDAILSSHKWHVVLNRGRAYAMRTEKGGRDTRRRKISMHREIAEAPPGALVDHRVHAPGKVVDNRRANLRVVTDSQNSANSRKTARRRCSSLFKGVARASHSPGRWAAFIQVDGRRRYVGTFREEGVAALAYDLAAVRHFGEHALTNFAVPGSAGWLYG